MPALAPYARWRARRVWLRDPVRAVRLLDSIGESRLDGEALGLRAWLALTFERDEARAERTARAALERRGDNRFASAALAEALLRRGEHDAGLAVLRAARERLPEVPWYEITLADALEEAGRPDEAMALLEERATGHPELRRHALKRLSRLAFAGRDRAEARRWYEELVALGHNYLVYATDHVRLAELQLADGDEAAARETLRGGAAIYPVNREIRALRAERFGESEPLATPARERVSEERVGARRIPVRTELITARTGLAPVIDRATAELRQAGDVIAVGESPSSAGQGRIVPLELVKAGSLARLLSRFVGEIGPLHSPEGMQGAIMEAGRPRVVLGALAAAIGKLFGRRGWFYRVAGPGAAMIDDVAAAMPPHDHHVVFGPRAPAELAGELAAELGCGVAIVDANPLSGAWVVGASEGVDAAWVEAALSDNPAGNEDERTPVVILRPLGTAAPPPAVRG